MLVLRPSWRSRAVRARINDVVSIEMRLIDAEEAEELLIAATQDGELQVVCTTDEEQGTLHRTMALFGLPTATVPDPPCEEQYPLEEGGMALVVEHDKHGNLVFTLYERKFPF